MLESPRLDGPLVRCRRCGLVYVGRRERDFAFAVADSQKSHALSRHVDTLDLVDRGVEDAEEPWRRRLFEDRLNRLRRHADGGALLDVGCASGDFLAVAESAGFDAQGVEPEPTSSARARRRGLRVTSATLEEASFEDATFDVVTLFHVLEHMDSPRAGLVEVRRILGPGGLLAIETPTIDSVWFALMRRRWRQLIPDHYYFFAEATLGRLLEECGFQRLTSEKVGKPASVRFVVDRVRRLSVPAGGALRRLTSILGVEDRTLNLNPGDVMLTFARKRDAGPSP